MKKKTASRPAPVAPAIAPAIVPGLTVTWHDPYAHIDLTGQVTAISQTGQNALVTRPCGGRSWVAVPTLKPV